MLPGKRCAFINFKQKTAAEAAYEDMLVSTRPGGPLLGPAPTGAAAAPMSLPRQDADLEGSRLVLQLKHPSHATPSPWQRP